MEKEFNQYQLGSNLGKKNIDGGGKLEGEKGMIILTEKVDINKSIDLHFVFLWK